jgi:hypothetical protein
LQKKIQNLTNSKTYQKLNKFYPKSDKFKKPSVFQVSSNFSQNVTYKTTPKTSNYIKLRTFTRAKNQDNNKNGNKKSYRIFFHRFSSSNKKNRGVIFRSLPYCMHIVCASKSSKSHFNGNVEGESSFAAADCCLH